MKIPGRRTLAALALSAFSLLATNTLAESSVDGLSREGLGVQHSHQAPMPMEDQMLTLLFQRVETGDWAGVAVLGVALVLVVGKRSALFQRLLLSLQERWPWLESRWWQLALGSLTSVVAMLANALVAGQPVTWQVVLRAILYGLGSGAALMFVPAKQVAPADPEQALVASTVADTTRGE